jgi:ATP-dependent Lhr-like helicase
MFGYKTSGFQTQDMDEKITLAANPFGRSTARIPRSLKERWKGGPPIQGNWFSIAGDSELTLENENDPLAEDELNRARLRMLLGRLGFLCRPLLEHEAPQFSWSKLLPTIRRMELAGELIAGRFFSGINSLQFAPPGIARELEEAETELGIFSMNAADPASPCGVPALVSLFENSKIKLPTRIPSSRICFKGTEIIAVSTKSGKELELDIPADDEIPQECIDFICFPKKRSLYPEKKLVVEKINGKTAASSSFADKLKEHGFVSDRGKLVLW